MGDKPNVLLVANNMMGKNIIQNISAACMVWYNLLIVVAAIDISRANIALVVDPSLINKSKI